MKIITGYTGEKQITSDNDASIFTGIIGKKNYVLNTMNNLAYQLMGNNIIRIKSGVVNYGGKYGIIEEYEDVPFENGKQGATRTDMLVARYEKDELTGIESIKLVMITGTSSVPAKPLSTDFPLYTITLNGINVASVKPQFDILLSMKELKELIENKAKSIASDMTAMENRLKSNDTTIEGKIKQVESSLTGKINTLSGSTETKIAELKSETNHSLNIFEERIFVLDSRVATLESRVKAIEKKL